MTRLFLATALVLHLSGVSAVAAFVCAQPGMTAQTCCCHHEPSDTPIAAPVCPCAMAPERSAPVSDTPVTVSASLTLGSMPAILATALPDAAADLRLARITHAALIDTSPPLLSASHLRC